MNLTILEQIKSLDPEDQIVIAAEILNGLELNQHNIAGFKLLLNNHDWVYGNDIADAQDNGDSGCP